jgi:hypothetical protein
MFIQIARTALARFRQVAAVQALLFAMSAQSGQTNLAVFAG